jgi:hypothetical protein
VHVYTTCVVSKEKRLVLKRRKNRFEIFYIEESCSEMSSFFYARMSVISARILLL